MNRTRFSDWYGELERAFDGLRARCETVFAMGLSMGGTLTLRLAEERGDAARRAGHRQRLAWPPSAATPSCCRCCRRVLPSFPGIASDIKKPGVTELAYDRIPLGRRQLAAAGVARRAPRPGPHHLPGARLPQPRGPRRRAGQRPRCSSRAWPGGSSRRRCWTTATTSPPSTTTPRRSSQARWTSSARTRPPPRPVSARGRERHARGTPRQRAAGRRLGRAGRPRPAPRRDPARAAGAGRASPAYVEPASAAGDPWPRRRAAQPAARPAVGRPGPRQHAREVVTAEVADLTALLAESEPGATAHGLVQPVPRHAARRVLTRRPPPPVPPPRLRPRRPPRPGRVDEDELFRQIVAGFDTPGDDPVPRWPVAEDTGVRRGPGPTSTPPAADPRRSTGAPAPARRRRPARLARARPRSTRPTSRTPTSTAATTCHLPRRPRPAVSLRTLGAVAVLRPRPGAAVRAPAGRAVGDVGRAAARGSRCSAGAPPCWCCRCAMLRPTTAGRATAPSSEPPPARSRRDRQRDPRDPRPPHGHRRPRPRPRRRPRLRRRLPHRPARRRAGPRGRVLRADPGLARRRRVAAAAADAAAGARRQPGRPGRGGAARGRPRRRLPGGLLLHDQPRDRRAARRAVGAGRAAGDGLRAGRGGRPGAHGAGQRREGRGRRSSAAPAASRWCCRRATTAPRSSAS